MLNPFIQAAIAEELVFQQNKKHKKADCSA